MRMKINTIVVKQIKNQLEYLGSRVEQMEVNKYEEINPKHYKNTKELKEIISSLYNVVKEARFTEAQKEDELVLLNQL